MKLLEMCVKSIGNLNWVCWSMTFPFRQLHLIRCWQSLWLEARRGWDERLGRQTSERMSRLPVMFVYIHRLVQELPVSMRCWSR